MFGSRLVARAAFAIVFTVVLLSSSRAKAQGVCNFLSGSQRTACHDAAVALSNKKASDAQKAKAGANQPAADASGAASGVGSSAAGTAGPESAGALVPVAQQSASSRSQTCSGLKVSLVSLVRTGPGDVTASYLLFNTKNDDMATFVYYGGAAGKNTFLIDDSGSEWPKKKVSGNGNYRQALIAGVNTKYQIIFHIASGGQDARSFQVITYFQLLPLAGIGEFGWCSVKFPNVPLSAEADPEKTALAVQPTSPALNKPSTKPGFGADAPMHFAQKNSYRGGIEDCTGNGCTGSQAASKPAESLPACNGNLPGMYCYGGTVSDQAQKVLARHDVTADDALKCNSVYSVAHTLKMSGNDAARNKPALLQISDSVNSNDRYLWDLIYVLSPAVQQAPLADRNYTMTRIRDHQIYDDLDKYRVDYQPLLAGYKTCIAKGLPPSGL
jgi:hypothetical protein